VVAYEGVIAVVHLPHDVIYALAEHHRVEEQRHALRLADEQVFEVEEVLICSLQRFGRVDQLVASINGYCLASIARSRSQRNYYVLGALASHLVENVSQRSNETVLFDLQINGLCSAVQNDEMFQIVGLHSRDYTARTTYG
jgi:hypothetical protein